MSSKKEKPLHSLVAGATAGAVEAFITYPMEFVKTRSQFGGKREPPLTIIRETLRSHGVRGMYAGCNALVIGNSVKAGVRFVSYERFKQALADKDVSFPPFPLYVVVVVFVNLVITIDRLTHRSWHQGKSQRAAKSLSRARGWDDGGHLRRHTFRNDQNETNW